MYICIIYIWKGSFSGVQKVQPPEFELFEGKPLIRSNSGVWSFQRPLHMHRRHTWKIQTLEFDLSVGRPACMVHSVCIERLLQASPNPNKRFQDTPFRFRFQISSFSFLVSVLKPDLLSRPLLWNLGVRTRLGIQLSTKTCFTASVLPRRSGRIPLQ